MTAIQILTDRLESAERAIRELNIRCERDSEWHIETACGTIRAEKLGSDLTALCPRNCNAQVAGLYIWRKAADEVDNVYAQRL